MVLETKPTGLLGRHRFWCDFENFDSALHHNAAGAAISVVVFVLFAIHLLRNKYLNILMHMSMARW